MLVSIYKKSVYLNSRQPKKNRFIASEKESRSRDPIAPSLILSLSHFTSHFYHILEE